MDRELSSKDPLRTIMVKLFLTFYDILYVLQDKHPWIIGQYHMVFQIIHRREYELWLAEGS